MESAVQPSVEERVSPAAELVNSTAADAGISIIVPCWREDSVTDEKATMWLASKCVREVLIASASNAPGPAAAARPGVRVISCCRPGRGHQMNEAARLAKGGILLFHHADTELNDEHLQSLSDSMRNPDTAGGAFRRRFDERHPYLRWLEPWEALRCRLFGPVFGDQSIFARRAIFEKLGGFAEVPLMEDVEFTCRLRRHTGGLTILNPAIGSSARKHLQQGSWRTTLTNTALLVLYILGVPPQRLHGWYYRRPRG